MMFIVEGTVKHPVAAEEQRASSAWLGPMTDRGFLHGGWVDASRSRVWMIVSAADLGEAQELINDLPLARAGSVSFDLTPVAAPHQRLDRAREEMYP